MFRINVALVFMIALLLVKNGMGISTLSTPAADIITENNAKISSSIKVKRKLQEHPPGSVAIKEEGAATSTATSPNTNTSPTTMSTDNNDGTLTVTKFNGRGFKQTLYNMLGLQTRRLRHN
ncbi:unnamed protein product [Peronospora destructor]|uniref:RxLR effector protein n=1 Tax=Peronospora destructor TaxID=86335 RepID=A0AAV0UJK9_9STRA|nr:unnamed protein product [Peronospora destructor]